MPCDDLKEIVDTYDASFMFTSLVMNRSGADVTKLVQKISGDFPDKRILVTGSGFLNVPEEEVPNNVFPVRSGADFLKSII